MDEPRYWFPAKRYGWGWGLPITWQGWIVFGVYFALFVIGVFLFPPRGHTGAFVAYVVLITAGLVVVCYVKGEPPRWRWGK
jgi:hypothetical protein